MSRCNPACSIRSPWCIVQPLCISVLRPPVKLVLSFETRYLWLPTKRNERTLVAGCTTNQEAEISDSETDHCCTENCDALLLRSRKRAVTEKILCCAQFRCSTLLKWTQTPRCFLTVRSIIRIIHQFRGPHS